MPEISEIQDRLVELNPDDVLDEFEVKKFLGEGKSRFAKTYESKSDSAIKLFVASHRKPAYPLLYEKFQREVEILDVLSASPHVMNRVTEFRERGVHNTVSRFAPYYVMELMEGDLEKLLIEPDLVLSLPAKLGIITQIISAAIDFHKLGICHRDLYTPNILYKTVDGEIVCKVADFGSAKDIHRPQTNPYFEPTGNNSYSSPEAAVGLLGGDTVSEELMRESDVFALGLMMYEILTGSRQEAVHTAIAGVNGMARQNDMYSDKTTMDERIAFLHETAMPTMEVGISKIVDITENDILDSEELAIRLTKIMRSMLKLDYTTRLSDLSELSNELTQIKLLVEART
ncbi:MAG: protein kinase [Candidatus Saccharimonadales bacterium]